MIQMIVTFIMLFLSIPSLTHAEMNPFFGHQRGEGNTLGSLNLRNAPVAPIGDTVPIAPITPIVPISPIEVFPIDQTPILRTMPVPGEQQAWQYPPTASPVANIDPEVALPVGVGSVATGGSNVSLKVVLSRFSGRVDIYFGLFAPTIDPNNIYIIKPDNTLQPLSRGVVPWKSNTLGNIDEGLFGTLQTSNLPSGTYHLFLAATPAGSLNSFYFWGTSFVVSRFVTLGDSGVLAPGIGDIVLREGDLIITSTSPVQVLDGAPLVRGKGTAFRVFVRSTFFFPVNARFRLTLPSSQWGFVTGSAANLTGLPAGWTWPEIWGPIQINPGDNEIMLPLIPTGQEDADVSVTNPPGIVRGSCAAGRCGPDVRVLPVPRQQVVSYMVEVDPDNQIAESNEGNNISARSSLNTIGALGWTFLFVPTLAMPNCPPRLNVIDETARKSIEYVLGTYPIGDMTITYRVVPATTTIPCPDNPGQQCGYAITVPEGQDRTTFFNRLKAFAQAQGYTNYSFIVGITCGGGGGTVGGVDDAAFTGDDPGSFGVLAHEFMHAVAQSHDIYSLDCLVGWDERYCEYSDGRRDYCCILPTMQHRGRYCYLDSYRNTVCSPDETTENCDRLTNGPDACQTACQGICGSGTVYGGPDCRIRHPSSKGLWANKWAQIDERMNYFMDCHWPLSAPFPYYWTILGNTTQHCLRATNQDGYLNLLNNGKFRLQ